jgi:hypothetical protein
MNGPGATDEMDKSAASNAGTIRTAIGHTVEFDERASFVDYVNIFKTPQTKAFLNLRNGHVSVFFDYHTIGEDGTAAPARLGHRAILTAVFSHHWLRLREILNADIDSNDLLGVLQDFMPFVDDTETDKLDQFLSSASAISGRPLTSLEVRPAGDIAVSYRQLGGRGSAASVQFPHELWLNVRVVVDGPSFHITSQFRYRLSEHALFVRPRIFEFVDIERAALQSVRENLIGELGMPIFVGNPVLDLPRKSSPSPEDIASIRQSEAAKLRLAVLLDKAERTDGSVSDTSRT